ncbi:MAG: sugar-transfer associated ATP-grasp domain-containing protein, partial [Alphaproteobacteria bacterium]
ASIYKFAPYQYIKHQLFRDRSDEDIFDFIPPKLVERLRNNANSTGNLRLAVDKLAFYEWCEEHEIPTPATRPFGEMERLCRGSVGSSPGEYFVKPRFGGSGRNVGRFITFGDEKFLLFSKIHRAADASRVAAQVGADEDYIMQDYVRQHPVISALYAGSVNTIRVETIDTGREIIVNTALLRVGTGMSVSDNWSTGGLIVNIDTQTGRTDGSARRKLKYGGQTFDRHPDTDAQLSGIQIPHWRDVREICEKAAAQIRPFKMLGWDVAITEGGAVLIEVNADYSINMCQEASRGLRKTYWGKYF